MNDLITPLFIIVGLLCVIVFVVPVLWVVTQFVINPILWGIEKIFSKKHVFMEDDLPL